MSARALTLVVVLAACGGTEREATAVPAPGRCEGAQVAWSAFL